MSAAALEPETGVQTPRILSRPEWVSSTGPEVVDLCEQVGLVLDPWQRLAVDVALAESADGKWAAFEVGLITPRQNGKNVVLEALELGGLFLLGEELILHSAHEFKVANESFRRVVSWIDNSDMLRRRVKRIRTSNGEEGVELLSGQRLRFVARSTGSGRGFTGDRQILDEAFNLPATAMAAMLPTLSARPNPQIVYSSSAGLPTSEVLGAVRQRGVDGGSSSLAWLEWSAPDDADPADPTAWAQANPALGYRISAEHIGREREAMPVAEFARERLGVWSLTRDGSVFPLDQWRVAQNVDASPGQPLVFFVDVSPGAESASIVAADADTVELVAHRSGAGWLPAELRRLSESHRPRRIGLDPAGPAGAMLPGLRAAGLSVQTLTARDMVAACGGFAQALAESAVAVRPHESLDAAVLAARRRTVGDGWALRRSTVSADICPLVAAVGGLWLARGLPAVSLVDQIF